VSLSARAVVISAIDGTAGVGKTTLAIVWAHQVRELFPDGQLYVNLRGYDPGPPVTPAEVLGYNHDHTARLVAEAGGTWARYAIGDHTR
jgi:predicted ATPase